MSILIRVGPDPFTEASHTADSPLLLAISDVHDHLKREITRYANQETAGRSFLVSGHRGAGKTTVVMAAIQRAAQELQATDTPLKPLFVRIHGPDLFKDPDADSNGAQTAVSGKATEKPPTTTFSPAALDPFKLDPLKKDAAPAAPTRETKAPDAPVAAPDASSKPAKDVATEGSLPEVVLKQVTIALFRAAADEFSAAFRDRIEADLKSPDKGQDRPFPRGFFEGAQASELLELAWQLRIELDGAPALNRLRFFWSYVGKLRSGVLFRRPQHADQGMRELVALSSAAQAYKVVSGRWEEKEAQKQAANTKSTLAVKVSESVKNLVNPVIGLVSGSFTGATLLNKELNPFIAPLVGVLTAVAVTAALNYSASSSDERDEEREVTFLLDRTISSLDRMLPLLVDRFRRAGLAPVFVVDELDKVEDLEGRMGGLIRHLKHFVTERALFCFLTDRDYIEYLAQQAAKTPYPREYTYFSDRLFVFYRPHQLREYVKQTLVLEPSDDKSHAATEAIDLDLLPFVLLHRSKLHAIDLRRELFRLRDKDDKLTLETGVLSSTPRYQIDVFAQLAVELVLTQAQVQERLSQDPEFVQVIFDALYFASRQWETGETKLKADEQSFRVYLKARMRLAPEQSLPLASSDIKFLHRIARDVIDSLVYPGNLVDSWQTTGGAPSAALEAVPVVGVLAAVDPIANLEYIWRFDPFGRSLAGLDQAEANLQIVRFYTLINEITAALSALGPELDLALLSAGCRILSTSPAWEFVSAALNRLVQSRSLPETVQTKMAAETERDLYAVRNFVVQINRDRETLTKAIAIGALLAKFNKTGIREGLQVLSKSLNLQEASFEQTRDRISEAWQQWTPSADVSNLLTAAANSEWESWGDAMKTLLAQIPTLGDQPAALDRAEKAAWERWQNRLFGGSSTGGSGFIDLDDLTLAAKDRGPVIKLGRNRAAITLIQWTELLLRAAQEPNIVPKALFSLALAELGFQTSRTRRGQLNGVTGVLLIVAPSDSIATEWRPSARYGCFAIPKDRLPELLKVLDADRKDFRASPLDVNFALIEIQGGPDELAAQLKKTPADLLGIDLEPRITPAPSAKESFMRRLLRLFKPRPARLSMWFRYLVPKLPTELPGERYSRLISPDSLDDAIAKLRLLAVAEGGETSSSSPPG